MPIKRYEEFEYNRINEDTTSNLIQQKNSLTKQINDLQKKLLDVQAQLVNTQKQTLNQNPEAQIPMQENFGPEENWNLEPLPQGADVIDASYTFTRMGKGELYVNYTAGGMEEAVDAEIDDFEEFIDEYIKDNFERHDPALRRFVRYDEDPHSGYFDYEDFWDSLDRQTQKEVIINYLRKKNLLS